MKKELYFKELGIVLGRSGFTTLPEQDGILPVEYEGRRLCRVDATGSVFYHQDNVNIESWKVVSSAAVKPGRRTSSWMRPDG